MTRAERRLGPTQSAAECAGKDEAVCSQELVGRFVIGNHTILADFQMRTLARGWLAIQSLASFCITAPQKIVGKFAAFHRCRE